MLPKPPQPPHPSSSLTHSSKDITRSCMPDCVHLLLCSLTPCPAHLANSCAACSPHPLMQALIHGAAQGPAAGPPSPPPRHPAPTHVSTHRKGHHNGHGKHSWLVHSAGKCCGHARDGRWQATNDGQEAQGYARGWGAQTKNPAEQWRWHGWRAAQLQTHMCAAHMQSQTRTL